MKIKNIKKEYVYGGLAIAFFAIAIGVSAHFIHGAPNRNLAESQQGLAFEGSSFQPADGALQAPGIVDTAPKSHYIEISDACNYAFQGDCVNVRSGPGTNYPSVLRLRNGMVFKVDPETIQADGQEWYKIIFDDNVRYPERVTSDWYVAKIPGSVTEFTDPGVINLDPKTAVKTDKKIVVDLSKETLTAYDGDTVYMTETISRGVATNPTPVGTFSIYRKTPTRYMQGPLPGETDEYYDLPGTPWDLYFSLDGAVLHGAYWHDDFGSPRSHGCVNQTPENAKKLYQWADIGTSVIVQQ